MEKAYITLYSRPGRAVSRLVLGSERSPFDERSSAKTYDFKLLESISRTKAIARELRFCNSWQYFRTLTISPDKADRYNWSLCCKRISKFFNNFKSKYAPDFKYLLIPESHIDGAIHCHRLLSGVPSDCVYRPDLVPVRVDYELINGRKVGGHIKMLPNIYGYERLKHYNLGFCSIELIRDQDRCSSYILKYITKAIQGEYFGESFLKPGDRIIRASKGLKRASKFSYSVDIKNTNLWYDLVEYLGRPQAYDFCDLFQDLTAEQLSYCLYLIEDKYGFLVDSK